MKKTIIILSILVILVLLLYYYIQRPVIPDEFSSIDTASKLYKQKDLVVKTLQAFNPKWNPDSGFSIVISNTNGLLSEMNELHQHKSCKYYGLHLRGKNLRDLSCLKDLPISILIISEADISNISKIPVQYLKIIGIMNCSQIKNFSTLSRLNLEKTDFEGTNINDNNFPQKLQTGTLNLFNTNISSLKIIDKEVKRLGLYNNNKIHKFNDLQLFTLLEELFVSDQNKLERIILNSKVNLKKLTLVRVPVNSLSFVVNNSNLHYLRIEQLPIIDFSDISQLSNLKTLFLRNVKFKTLSFIKGLRLETLKVSKTLVSDIEILKDMPLKHLDLSFTNVKNIQALKGMPLQFLSLENTGVQDLSPISYCNLLYLNILNTPAASMPLPENLKVKTLIR